MPTSENVDVAILGAGISGCALAHHLSARGVGPVLVYDPRTPAAGASGRAGGVVTEQLWDSWSVEVTRDSKAQYAALAQRWDPSAYSTNGFAQWIREPAWIPAMDAAFAQLRKWNVNVRVLDPVELARLVPVGRFDDVQRTLWSPEDGIVTPSTMTEIYAENAKRAGVEFWLGTPFGRLQSLGEGWELSGSGRSVRARRLVVAAGAWSKRILAEVGRPLPLCPYRTQAAVLRPGVPAETLFPTVHDLDTDVYARPESNGRILAGDGTERVEADPENFYQGGDDSFVVNLAECFERRFPGWADAALVRAWAGVCTSTPDRRPLIGPVAGASGLFVMAGFNGMGVMRAGGVARRLAALLSAGDGASKEESALDPVRPDRFGAETEAFRPRPGFTLEGGADPRF